ncbi:hypothetical protein NDU88_003975 [Pleurodeles waltl]|uniref:Uncharacterized protein n=1 Tax=Pleurodeles waltl TaxID=8319 RepID=A0AAV7MAB3_PLEWA|nr:hypothetical protein NDU88_003975 [Pleurodeles waltl]
MPRSSPVGKSSNLVGEAPARRPPDPSHTGVQGRRARPSREASDPSSDGPCFQVPGLRPREGRPHYRRAPPIPPRPLDSDASRLLFILGAGTPSPLYFRGQAPCPPQCRRAATGRVRPATTAGLWSPPRLPSALSVCHGCPGRPPATRCAASHLRTLRSARGTIRRHRGLFNYWCSDSRLRPPS